LRENQTNFSPKYSGKKSGRLARPFGVSPQASQHMRNIPIDFRW
jgi:hypothetical protein